MDTSHCGVSIFYINSFVLFSYLIHSSGLSGKVVEVGFADASGMELRVGANKLLLTAKYGEQGILAHFGGDDLSIFLKGFSYQT